MATETIFISLVSGTTELHLTDNEGHSGDGNLTTDVSPGDTVIWKISAGANISSISSIYKKVSSQDIFSTDPSEQNSGFWKGTVSDSATGKETYGIKYMIDGKEYDCDPVLQVKI